MNLSLKFLTFSIIYNKILFQIFDFFESKFDYKILAFQFNFENFTILINLNNFINVNYSFFIFL